MKITLSIITLLLLAVSMASTQNRAIRVRAIRAIRNAGMIVDCDKERDCTHMKVQLKVPESVYQDNLDLYRDLLTDFWRKIQKLGFRKIEARTADRRMVFRQVKRREE